VAITSKRAAEIETKLAELGIDPHEFHDWVMRRIYQSDDSGRRITRVTMVRGSHGASYVYDPEGTDELPPGYSQPPPPLQIAS
jgi:hypothetical protein